MQRIYSALKDAQVKHRTCLAGRKGWACAHRRRGTGGGGMWCGVLMKAPAVSQTAGGTLHGDVHLRRSVLTTSINHQSHFIFQHCHILISPCELMHDIYAKRMDFFFSPDNSLLYTWRSLSLARGVIGPISEDCGAPANWRRHGLNKHSRWSFVLCSDHIFEFEWPCFGSPFSAESIFSFHTSTRLRTGEDLLIAPLKTLLYIACEAHQSGYELPQPLMALDFSFVGKQAEEGYAHQAIWRSKNIQHIVKFYPHCT